MRNQPLKDDVRMGIPSDAQAALEARLLQMEEEPRRYQQQHEQTREDSVKDAQATESYLTPLSMRW